METTKTTTTTTTEAGIKVHITATPGDKPAHWQPAGQHYRVAIRTDLGRASFDYWGSRHDLENGIDCNPLDALGCFASDALSGYDSFKDFCGNFGYDTDSRKAERIWKACKASTTKAQRLGILVDDLPALADR